MSILVRSFNTYRFFELVNRVCLIQSISCFSDAAAAAAGKDLTNTSNVSVRSCDFEVFGTVQHVYFRKYTQQEAIKLNLVGWVQNTDKNTVQGHMEGYKPNIEQMKIWLQTIGSPKSKITKVEFKNQKSITESTSKTFEIRK
ncbi:unnamed protein product [Rotaria magnacalcarata]|uniref:acylphosphatase n=1 Tax=Rotaria magnacalcarata TaxID=392030 RepID=A0A816TJD6_9BILA|nr:unnamed protein product [Rotaria magnacalcarata]CAF1522648.1 unnamed protein product [Rotaria magnacalcarata]CAF2096087.1 unnamed protein product [Rotaria magnacalcarata]CAF2132006.1 unnamed protein product [Rotaria magnacalcarata]CAF4506099.1 unnamed protein product [Rotaria magnacalcarata]